MTMFDDIKAFHKKFELEYSGPPRALPSDLGPFRTRFMGEELAEYISPLKSQHAQLSFVVGNMVSRAVGLEPQSLEKQMDALIDLVYVALGTAYLHGFDMEEGWRRVHEANMKKVKALRDEESTRGVAAFDVVKPEGWTAPDLSDLVLPKKPEPPTIFTEYDGECIPGN